MEVINAMDIKKGKRMIRIIKSRWFNSLIVIFNIPQSNPKCLDSEL
jgi:hypothetical protein